MKFTILGASGFIGSNMCRYLDIKGVEYLTPGKEFVFSKDINLGHVIYAIGLTADFRKRPMDTVKAHVCKLMEVLENASFDSFTYLSSTRVYLNSEYPANEDASVVVNPNEFGDLYNISKIMGESVCLSFPGNVRIARISNVLGDYKNADNFLSDILNEINSTGKLRLHSSLDSAKDYIAIEDVISLLYNISTKGRQRIYNIASGANTTNKQIIELLTLIKSFEPEVDENIQVVNFPVIEINRIKEEFDFSPTDVINYISALSQRFLHN